MCPLDRKKLLVLDLDETLIHASQGPLHAPADFRVFDYHVYKRPHLDSFLAACFRLFQVGVWTSASPDYAAGIVANLVQDPSRLAFLWARPRCTARYCGETFEWVWQKVLQKLLRRGYRRQAIIAVDDSPEKWSRSYGNLVRVRPFTGQPDDRELLPLADYLAWLAEQPDVRPVDKRAWRGQAAGPGPA